MSELKPCPFCGSYERHMCQIPSYYKINPHIWYVKCDTCEAQGARHFTKAEAVAAWNSRAERTCKQEERGWGTEGDHARVWLTCGHDCMVPTVQDLPNYCPNCGCKVVGE